MYSTRPSIRRRWHLFLDTCRCANLAKVGRALPTRPPDVASDVRYQVMPDDNIPSQNYRDTGIRGIFGECKSYFYSLCYIDK